MLETEYRTKLVKSLFDCGLLAEQVAKVVHHKSLWFLFGKDTSEDGAFWNFNARIEQAAALLDVSKEKYLTAALRQPPLFVTSPDLVKANVNGAIELLGISLKHRYIEAVLLRQPSLVSSSPGTVHTHYLDLKEVQQKGYIISDDLLEDVLRHPSSLTYSSNNTALRVFHAQLYKRTCALGTFFKKKSREVIEQEIDDCLTEKFNAGNLEFVDQAYSLHAQGILSRLPASFEMTAVPA